MNVLLRGKTKQIVEAMVEEGYTNSQSEAIRLALIDFADNHLSEVELVNRKLDKLDSEVSEGRSKLLDSKQALGEYSKHVK